MHTAAKIVFSEIKAYSESYDLMFRAALQMNYKWYLYCTFYRQHVVVNLSDAYKFHDG